MLGVWVSVPQLLVTVIVLLLTPLARRP